MPVPGEKFFACLQCRFAVDPDHEDSASQRERGIRWSVFPSMDVGLPLRFHKLSGNDPATVGGRDILPELDSALRQAQENAVLEDRRQLSEAVAPQIEGPTAKKWVVRHFGEGDVSYHSFDGPMRDPRDAHAKTQAVAQRVATGADLVGHQMGGMHAEAVPLDQAIREFRTRAGRHSRDPAALVHDTNSD